jgi:hypothetical protein
MSRQKIILSLVVICSISVLAGQSPSEKQKSQIPEYPQDFESGQQTTPIQPPNESRERLNQRMAERMRNMPDFARLRGMSPEQRIREMQRMAEEQEEQAMKQALGVDEEQWKVIKPKLDKVKACRERATVSIGLPFSSSFVSSTNSQQGDGFGSGFQFQFGGSGGGSSGSGSNMMIPDSSFQSQSNFQNQSNRRETQGQRICRELNALLDNFNSPPEAIRQKMLELQQARANAKKQLAQAQKELRAVLTLHQQARLVLMGVLD